MIEPISQSGDKGPDQMWAFDERVRCEGYDVVAGVDEVGRGCLAGPVVAAAVILPRDFRDTRIRDSKQLTARMRDTLFEVITGGAVSYGIGVIPVDTIDSINILRASLQAMVHAIENLNQQPDIVLVDGSQGVPMPVQQMTITKGDSKSISIACGSIIAKVHRDRLMCELDIRYPGYGFASNKGYGSKAHVAFLEEHGPCPVHRTSFAPVRRVIEANAEMKQDNADRPRQSRTLNLPFKA